MYKDSQFLYLQFDTQVTVNPLIVETSFSPNACGQIVIPMQSVQGSTIVINNQSIQHFDLDYYHDSQCRQFNYASSQNYNYYFYVGSSPAIVRFSTFQVLSSSQQCQEYYLFLIPSNISADTRIWYSQLPSGSFPLLSSIPSLPASINCTINNPDNNNPIIDRLFPTSPNNNQIFGSTSGGSPSSQLPSFPNTSTIAGRSQLISDLQNHTIIPDSALFSPGLLAGLGVMFGAAFISKMFTRK